MGGFFDHPVVQGAIAPFVVALVLAIVLRRFNLAGLAVGAALATAAYYLHGLILDPLTITRKILLLGLGAAAAGFVADALFRAGPRLNAALAVLGAVGSIWAFWSVLIQKTGAKPFLLGGEIALFAGLMIIMLCALQAQPVRAGGAALGLGVGTGVAAILGASATYGLYGIAIGAGAGGFLLVQMVSGRTTAAGALFALPAGLAAALFGAGAMLLAELAWYAMPLLLLVPAAAFLPLPQKKPVWLQTIVVSMYTFVAAAVACVLAWHYEGNAAG